MKPNMCVSDLLLPEKTKVRFGYDPRDLSYGSPKKVIHKCDTCGEDKENRLRRFLNGVGLSHKKCKYKMSKLALKQTNLLLLKETEEKFGYNPQDLSQGSERMVLHKCDVCRKPKRSCFKIFFRGEGLSHSECKGKKAKQTNLQKYGVDNPQKSKEIREKTKQTCVEKYGVDHPWKSRETQEKRKQSWIKNYGVEYPGQSKEVQGKIRQTRLNNGYDWTEQRAQQFVQSFGYQLIEWGEGVHNRSVFECPKGNRYTAKLNDFQQGNRCPICNESKGERIVAEILSNKKIGFTKEHRLQKGKSSLRLDFYIPSLNLGIEYDGEQHFRSITGAFGSTTKEQAEAAFKKQQQNDKRKNELCKRLDIELIRVKYTDNIKQILESYLNKKMDRNSKENRSSNYIL